VGVGGGGGGHPPQPTPPPNKTPRWFFVLFGYDGVSFLFLLFLNLKLSASSPNASLLVTTVAPPLENLRPPPLHDGTKKNPHSLSSHSTLHYTSPHTPPSVFLLLSGGFHMPSTPNSIKGLPLSRLFFYHAIFVALSFVLTFLRVISSFQRIFCFALSLSSFPFRHAFKSFCFLIHLTLFRLLTFRRFF